MRRESKDQGGKLAKGKKELQGTQEKEKKQEWKGPEDKRGGRE